MNELEFVFWLEVILSVVLLICFFKLCLNVSKIRKKFVPNESFNASFSMYLAMGDKENARKLLYEEICKQQEFIIAFYYNGNNKEARTALKNRFKAHLEALGIDFDFSESDKFIVELEK